MDFSCQRPDITPAFMVFTMEDFKDCIDVSTFNKDHGTDFDNYELKVISQQDFRDVSLSLNGVERGYWPLPCRITLLPDYSRPNNIRVIPCVRFFYNTKTTTRYHFLEPVEEFFDLEKEGEYRFPNLKFKYRESVSFPVLETFIQDTRFSSIDTIHGATLEISQIEEEGVVKPVGKVVLGAFPYFNIATDYFTLAAGGTQQFWEIYYKCDGEMTTYLDFNNATYPSQNMVVLLPTKGEWKKAYIDISQAVSDAAGYATEVSVRLGIRGNKVANSTQAYFYLGNIKLITMRAPY